MTLKSFSPRALALSYIAALLIIACLSVSSHVILDYGLKSNEGSAATINITGRQRMLSQRIAGLAAQYRLGDASAHDDMLSAIDKFEAAHRSLIAAIPMNPPYPDEGAQELHDLYFGTDHPLDSQVRDFIADARHVADLPAGDPAMDAFLPQLFARARAPLLEGLDHVVAIQQRQSERRLEKLEHLQWPILGTVLLTLLVEAMVIFRPMLARLTSYTSELLHVAATDSLTGASNRHGFIEKAEAAAELARRYNRAASILIIDIDRFKSINDQYGRMAGDKVLRMVVDVMRRTVRPTDIVGRLGGGQFAALLTEMASTGAVIIAERLREQLGAMTVFHFDHSIKFTVSIGVAAVPAEDDGLDKALRAADLLLDEAKQEGMNRVVSAPVLA